MNQNERALIYAKMLATATQALEDSEISRAELLKDMQTLVEKNAALEQENTQLKKENGKLTGDLFLADTALLSVQETMRAGVEIRNVRAN